MKPFISFESVTVGYRGRPALRGVTFRLEEPAFLTVIGPNGAGKTTLLRTMLGLIKPWSGRVIVMGYDVSVEAGRVRRLTGYVPQRERIDPSMPLLVKDVVLMGRVARSKPGIPLTKEDYEEARRALRLVGLEDMWDEPFSHLSGGQQQRVLIARALAARPKLLLLDEPLSGVDAASQEVIVDVLRREANRGVGVVMVTHDINPVMEVTDYVLLLNRRVIAFGTVTEVTKPDLMTLTYGRKVEIVRMGGACYVISGDSHA